MLTLTRQGVTPTRAQGLVDSLSLSYNGNQLKKVSDQISNTGLADSMDFKDYADEEIEYSFNMNGAMTQDLNKGITSIAYNYLNLPQEMLINASAAEAKTWYTYSATGQKLSVVYKWNSERQITPLTGSNLKAITGTVPDENSMDKDLTLDYVGNFIYENDSLKRILVVGGYIEDGNYYFYITDHLGNNRIVADASGDVVQSNEYYPFGLLMATSTEADKQPYKYGNKELDSYNGLNWYDFEARYLDSGVPSFTTQDPLAEKYYSISPYAYVANNPLKFIDPTGMKILLFNYTHYTNRGTVTGTRGLSNKTEAAMMDYVKTAEGRAFLAQYASAGDIVGGYKFEKDGALSNQTLQIKDFSYSKETGHVLPSGTMGSISKPQIDKDGNVTLTLKIQSLGYTKEDIVETVAHELQVHGYKNADEAKGKIVTTEKQDHQALKTKDKAHQGYKKYETVRKQLEAIDSKYKKVFQEAEKDYQDKY